MTSSQSLDLHLVPVNLWTVLLYIAAASRTALIILCVLIIEVLEILLHLGHRWWAGTEQLFTRLVVCISHSVCLSMYVCLSVCLSVCVCVGLTTDGDRQLRTRHVCSSVPRTKHVWSVHEEEKVPATVYFSLCLSLSVCLSVCLCLECPGRREGTCYYFLLCLSVCLSVCLSLSVCLCLSVSVCVCLECPGRREGTCCCFLLCLYVCLWWRLSAADIEDVISPCKTWWDCVRGMCRVLDSHVMMLSIADLLTRSAVLVNDNENFHLWKL